VYMVLAVRQCVFLGGRGRWGNHYGKFWGATQQYMINQHYIHEVERKFF